MKDVMERFVYEASRGGEIFVQKGGFAECGITANMALDEADILELALLHFSAALLHFSAADDPDWKVELPPFRLIIEPL